MALSEKEYADLRDKVINKYRILYKDSLAMDMCEVPKDIRIRMLDDPIYISKTKALKAGMFAQQLETIDSVLAGAYQGEKQTDQSSVVLKALEMRQKILFDDLNANKDDSSALNVTFVGMAKEDFEACETVEIFEGSNNSTELGADFGESDDDSSFEARMKAKTKEKLKELEGKKEV